VHSPPCAARASAALLAAAPAHTPAPAAARVWPAAAARPAPPPPAQASCQGWAGGAGRRSSLASSSQASPMPARARAAAVLTTAGCHAAVHNGRRHALDVDPFTACFYNHARLLTRQGAHTCGSHRQVKLQCPQGVRRLDNWAATYLPATRCTPQQHLLSALISV